MREVRIVEYRECDHSGYSKSITCAYRCKNKNSPSNGRVVMPSDYCPYGEKQAERVAWRILKDWIEAQMALLDIQMVKFEEVFMPYIVDKHGRTLFEKLEEQQFLIEKTD